MGISTGKETMMSTTKKEQQLFLEALISRREKIKKAGGDQLSEIEGSIAHLKKELGYLN